MVLERRYKGSVIFEMRVDRLLDLKAVALRMKRRKKEGRSGQDISPSIYASARPMSFAKRMRDQADGEWIWSSVAGACFL